MEKNEQCWLESIILQQNISEHNNNRMYLCKHNVNNVLTIQINTDVITVKELTIPNKH